MKSTVTPVATPTHALRVNVNAIAAASDGMMIAAHAQWRTSNSSRPTAAQITRTSSPEYVM